MNLVQTNGDVRHAGVHLVKFTGSRYATQKQYSRWHTVDKNTPLTLSFNRTQADLLKSLHFIVEPYHNTDPDAVTTAEEVDVFLRTTPQLLALDIDGINSTIFNHSFVAASVRPTPKQRSSGGDPPPQTLGDGSHVLQLIPLHHAGHACTHPSSVNTSIFNESYATYTLVVRTNASHDVGVHVRVFHAECVFNEGTVILGRARSCVCVADLEAVRVCGCCATALQNAPFAKTSWNGIMPGGSQEGLTVHAHAVP